MSRFRFRRAGVSIDRAPRPLLEKDRVVAPAIHDGPGTIERAGPQVCGIKFDSGVFRYIPNDYLQHVKATK